MRLPRQEYCSGLLFPSPGDLSDPGIKPISSALAGGFFTTEPPGKPNGTVPLAYSKPIKETGKLCEREMRRRRLFRKWARAKVLEVLLGHSRISDSILEVAESRRRVK